MEDCGTQACVVVTGCGARCTDDGGDSHAFCAPDAQPSPLCPPASEELVSDTADLRELEEGSFSTTGSMTVARANHTATLLSSGLMLVAGGAATTARLASTELYDPAPRTFAPTGSLLVARCMHLATLSSSGPVISSSTGSALSAGSLR